MMQYFGQQVGQVVTTVLGWLGYVEQDDADDGDDEGDYLAVTHHVVDAKGAGRPFTPTPLDYELR